jgi:ABC-type glycerol-3-phosphate transport system substrate-binding protein
MRNGLKLVVGLALLCALALGVASCGGGDESGNETASSPSERGQLSGTVTVWDFMMGSFPGYDPLAKRLDREFEEMHPNVTIDHVAQPFASFEATYKAAFTAQEGPDVLTMLAGNSGVLGYEAALEPLNDRIPDDMSENIDNWFTVTPGLAEGGERYGVPIVMNGVAFYYNKELFEKAGLPREFEPETWEEVKEAGEKLKAAGIQPFTGGNKEGYENGNWFVAGWQTENTIEQGIELLEGTMPYTDEAFANALRPAIMMQDAGLYPEDRFSTPMFPDGVARFGEEKGAMTLGGWGFTASYNEYNPELGTKNVGMFFPPGSNYIGQEANWVWSMPKFAKNKDAAWAYMEWLGSQSGIQAVADTGAQLPNRLDVEMPVDAAPQAKVILDTVRDSDGSLSPLLLLPPAVFAAFYTEINQVMQGRTSLEDAQQALQETAERTAG